ncbi:hypothetical protein BGX26_009355, partial [Mortierella sp. AD094]
MSILDASHDPNLPYNGYGFRLWNDADDNGQSSTVGYDSGASLSDGGWTVTINSHDIIYPKLVQVQNDKYYFNSKIHATSLCQYHSGQTTRFVNFGCFDSGNNWCQQKQDDLKAQCNSYIKAG